jgi:hypothetical protein
MSQCRIDHRMLQWSPPTHRSSNRPGLLLAFALPFTSVLAGAGVVLIGALGYGMRRLR